MIHCLFFRSVHFPSQDYYEKVTDTSSEQLNESYYSKLFRSGSIRHSLAMVDKNKHILMKHLGVTGKGCASRISLRRLFCSFTCSGLRPGGTQTYSSSAHPESSSEVEFLWKSYISLVMVFSISRDMAVTTCSSKQIASVSGHRYSC